MGSKVVLNITNEKYMVDFITKPNTLVNLLGFNKKIYTIGYNIAEDCANISPYKVSILIVT